MTNRCWVGRWATALALIAGVAGAAHAEQGAESAPVDYAADVVVERATIDRENRVVERMPTVRYRLIQRMAAAGLQTEVRFRGTPPFPGRGPLQDPSAGFRVVMSEAEGIQVFGPDGQRIAQNSAPAGPAPASPHESGLVAPRSLAERRAALAAAFGPAAGRVRTRQRFLRRTGEEVAEVLVDPTSSLPVEVNTVRGGKLLARSLFTYRTLPDGRVVRASQRDETAADSDDSSGRRSVTLTTYQPVAGGEQ
jgi:hypothetical protein